MGINRNGRNRNAAPSAGGGNMRSVGDVASSIRGDMVKAWTPTVANLVVLVLFELAAFAALRYLLRTLQR